MYFSDKDRHTIDNCRFCFMCRHVCPVAMVTGKEGDNARARAALLSLVVRGFEYSPDMAETVYECCLCGACTEQCATAFDPVTFTRSARLEAVMGGLAPQSVKEALARVMDSGRADETGGGTAQSFLREEIDSLPLKAPVLLYLGLSRRTCPENAANAIKVMKKAGVDFTVLKEEPDCASDLLDLMGNAEEVREAAEKTKTALNDTGAEKIVCLSPDSAKMFLHEYRGWGIELNAKIETFTSAAAFWIREGLLKPRKKAVVFTAQDSCCLARDLGETEPLREILRFCGNLREMYRHGKEAISCGEGAIGLYRPDLALKMAERRMADAKASGAEWIITSCPRSFYWLGKAGGLRVKAAETLLAECL